MLALSQARTRFRNASWSGVSVKSTVPPGNRRGRRALTERRFILGRRSRGSQGIYCRAVPSVSLARLRERLSALARFGALPGGGVTRMCWSPPHEEARAWLLGELKAAGLTTWVDPAGNVFGALGADRIGAAAPVVLTGSHIDTVPEGGILDGALGVMAGLECLHVIREAGGRVVRPVAVAAWSDEEGRYGSLFGSRAFCGRLDPAAIPTMAAVDGDRLVDAMGRAGFDARRAPEAAASRGSVAAYVELHIEQGPRLEEASIPIGVVEAIVGVRRARVVFHGQADHAGTTPMERRRDAFLAAADYALRARELVVSRGGARAVTNIGAVRAARAGDDRGGLRIARSRVAPPILRGGPRRAESRRRHRGGHDLHPVARRPQSSRRRDERLGRDRARRQRAAAHAAASGRVASRSRPVADAEAAAYRQPASCSYAAARSSRASRSPRSSCSPPAAPGTVRCRRW